MRRSVLAVLMAFILAGSARGQNNEEFRASWVVDTQWLSPENTVSENQALIRQILDNHVAGNFTSVIWQVRRFGTVYYPSAIEPWGPRTGLTNPGFDPTAFALEEAHARGLEFHAWLNVFESRNVFPGSPSQVNPDWVCRDRDGFMMPDEIAWLSPGLPEVRRYLVNLAMEVVNAYDIDGVHMDFIRWNEHTNSALSLNLAKRKLGDNLPDGIITEAQLNELQSNTVGRFLYDVEHPFNAGVPIGFDTWEDWWRSSVTEFVRTLHDTIQTVKPWVRLSPAALGRYNWGGWQGFNVVYQDAALWLNERSIEQIVGMHYHWDLPQDFQSILVSGCPSCWSQFLQPAIQAGQLYTVGLFSDRFSERRIFGRHSPIIDRVRDIPWVDGFQFFSYASWRDENYWNEGRRLFFNSKARIRATGLIENTAPDAPTIVSTKIDSLQYEIGVTPPASVQDNHWFAIYRSEDGNLNTNSDEIVDVHFGNSAYALVDTFAGTQDFNGTYTYFASTLDRFWNESGISNSARSEAIPSFAPTVIASWPAANDSISVTSDVTVTFSKTMNIGTFSNAVAFSPPLAVSELSWTGDNKILNIRTDDPFVFATDYTLTIQSTVADVNGRSLDGNADGQEGDLFQLAFKSFGQDLAGPRITFSFPDFETVAADFPVDEIITIVFDEILDASSVTSERISLRVGGVDVTASHNLTTISGRSVLSIQPRTQSLDPDLNYAVTLAAEISDTLGNQLGSDFSVAFSTSIERTVDITLVEPFFSTANWFQPNQSGSTTGIVVPNTRFEMSTDAFLPAVIPRQRISPTLSYEWDESASSYLLRLFLQGGAPRDVLFDSTFVLQCYVFGDGGNNKFRFAVDDSTKDQAAFHEVSEWVTINWFGWRLVEWQMSDPNSFGIWLGDGVLNGPSLRFDSFQLTHDPGDATTGRIFFDNLRLVKKSSLPVNVENGPAEIPTDFALYQNYPNPFNPTTTISFDVPYKGRVKLRVYDTLGRVVRSLIDEEREPGNYNIRFDAAGVASGVYFYRLFFGDRSISRRMMIVK